jgi:peroxiredoxin Q/BCP
MLKIGDKAPDFVLPDKEGRPFRLSEVIGKKAIVLYFYPKDFSPGCTSEACAFRDYYEVFKELGAEVIGISSDSKDTHNSFSRKYNLPFILLSDKGGEVRKLYGVRSTLFIPGRVTFIIDKEGIIRYVFSSQLNPKKHVEVAIKVIKEINRS